MPKSLAQLLSARLPSFASLLLVLALAVVVARLTWQVIPEEPKSDRLVDDQAVERSSAKPQSREGLEVPLFGEEQQISGPVVELIPVDAPPTRLDLKLRGIVLTDDKRPSLAIIEDNDRESVHYRIGDPLPGDSELLGIESERVILRHRGTIEALYFSEETPSTGTQARTDPRPQGVAASIQLSPQSSARVREYLSLLPSDPSRMTELVRALPVMENGQLKGFRLFPGQQRDLFGETGLRRGDIVTSINGLPLNDPTRGIELLNQMASTSRFQIEIQRRGQSQVLEIQL